VGAEMVLPITFSTYSPVLGGWYVMLTVPGPDDANRTGSVELQQRVSSSRIPMLDVVEN